MLLLAAVLFPPLFRVLLHLSLHAIFTFQPVHELVQTPSLNRTPVFQKIISIAQRSWISSLNRGSVFVSCRTVFLTDLFKSLAFETAQNN